MRRCGSPALEPTQDFPWQRLSTEGWVDALRATAGVLPAETGIEQFGYHLQSPNDWWEVVWYRSLADYG
ncbi:MAG: hypothetical protein K8I04_14990 [Gammaproteobacteria bacterium]|nr:hypothetical protein [Gammaproteobacteria bacterium]